MFKTAFFLDVMLRRKAVLVFLGTEKLDRFVGADSNTVPSVDGNYSHNNLSNISLIK